MNKINKETLAKKLEQLVPTDKEQFKLDLERLKAILVEAKPSYKKPLLIHSTMSKSAVFYMIVTYFSLQAGKILDYVITTGQNIITQHFLDNENKDMDFNSKLYYDDILFISISQIDYTSDYLESLIVDLIETRQFNGKATVIVYDLMEMPAYLSKLSNYFNSNDSLIIKINGQKTIGKAVSKKVGTKEDTKDKSKVRFF